MQDLMVALQELTAEEVSAARSCGGSPGNPGQGEEGPCLPVAPARVADPAGAEPCTEDEVDPALAIEVLKWATSCSELAVLETVRSEMPLAVLNEQVRLYKARSTKAPEPEVTKIVCNVMNLRDREKVCRALDEHCIKCGVDRQCKFPKGLLNSFLTEKVLFAGPKVKDARRNVRNWFRAWVKDGAPDHSKPAAVYGKRSTGCAVAFAARKRRAGAQGQPSLCPLIREQLFEWWQGMRYSIDWKGLEAMNRIRGRKCLTRFPRSVLKAKTMELMAAYCAECLLHGLTVKMFKLSSQWFKCWEREYGLTMRMPNRKYKVPKYVLEERMRLWWITLFRIRALCVAVNGYDPEMENWDQSPFHNNETGAQNVSTLAFKGAPEVPLIEGHTDTRKRWTGNFVTWSNKARILEEGPPYAEYCFKAEGDRLVLKLREHIRSRGYGPWVTVITSPKGSYRESDVLSFLDTHLPKFEHERRWRIIMGDDFAAHKADNVFRLCWSRGYVLVIHGGGCTPVGQTVDTDMNQHVKRDYMAREACELMSQFRNTTIPVPSVKECAAIDMMTEVLSRTQLHLDAADGYKKTGATVDIDGKEDAQICREAGKFWHELGMRAIIDREVALVREEAAAGRLKWTQQQVRSLINAYPAHRRVDDVLEKMGDDTAIPDDEKAYAEDDACEREDGESSDDVDAEETAMPMEGEEKENEEEDDDEEEGTEAWSREAAHGDGHGHSGAAVAVKSVDISGISVAEAEEVEKSETLIDALRQSVATLKNCGALSACSNLENEIRKERRRQRSLSKASTAVAVALVRQREFEVLQRERRRQLELDATKQMLKARTAAKVEAAQAKALLQKRKNELAQLENILETSQALKRFTPESMGAGHPKGCGAAGRKLRLEVLDRMARTGVGLSPAQKNDWQWFKQSWDQKMLEEHGAEWGDLFASWVQKAANDITKGQANTFSLLVHNETRRCFSDQPALRV